MKKEVKEKIVEILKKEGLFYPEIEDKIKVEPPKEESFGDLATNVAFLLTKHLKQKPQDIAEKIKSL
ncbi:MAG: arginine--tRNA ligase, partial [Sulfurihydrogenibium azorense]